MNDVMRLRISRRGNLLHSGQKTSGGFSFLHHSPRRHFRSKGQIGDWPVIIRSQSSSILEPMKTTLCSNYRARFALLTAITALSGFGGLGFASTARAADSDLPQLLERAIYSEETKGDLDSAMGLYQQIVADANASQALAAQAQLRLAICYDKKKDYAAATAAFEKRVHDFPAQKEYVALANEYLASGLPLLAAPWKDGEEMLLQIKAPTGVKAGVISYNVNSGTIDGRQIWNLHTHTFAGVNILSSSTVDANSFKPLSSQFTMPMMGQFKVHYGVGSADVTMPGQPTAKHIEISGAVYDNDTIIQLMRRLPLAAGYKASIKLLVVMGGGTIAPIEATVAAQEKVTVPAGTFDASKFPSVSAKRSGIPAAIIATS